MTPVASSERFSEMHGLASCFFELAMRAANPETAETLLHWAHASYAWATLIERGRASDGAAH